MTIKNRYQKQKTGDSRFFCFLFYFPVPCEASFRVGHQNFRHRDGEMGGTGGERELPPPPPPGEGRKASDRRHRWVGILGG